MADHQKLLNNLRVILGNDVEPNIVAYISEIKQVEDYEEFMENILNRNNSAHIHAYNEIKYLLFGGKHNKKVQDSVSVSKNSTTNVSTKAGEKTDSHKETQGGNTYSKKGKKKFRDIRDFQEKKKEKEGFCKG